MAKQHYFFKLIPPRPTFIQDMNDDERRLMDEHIFKSISTPERFYYSVR